MFLMYLLFTAEKSLLTNGRSPDGLCVHIWAIIVGFFVSIFTYARSIAFRITKRIRDSESNAVQNMPSMTVGSISKEESHPPSPATGFTKVEPISSALKRLGELEEKVDMLQSKPNVMPYEKEELLNAAVYRVDALEAELIATKKVTEFHLKSYYLLQARLTKIHVVLLNLKF